MRRKWLVGTSRSQSALAALDEVIAFIDRDSPANARRVLVTTLKAPVCGCGSVGLACHRTSRVRVCGRGGSHPAQRWPT